MVGTAYVPPPEGEAIQWEVVMGLIGSLNGYPSWQRLVNLVGVTDNSNYVVTINNQGTGGHLNVGAGKLQVTNTGVVITSLSLTNLLVSGTLGVTGTSTLGVVNSGAITSSSTVQGTRLISTIANGTAPLTVTSSTKVANLNADFLDDMTASEFALDTDLANYLPLAGGTITGNLAVDGTATIGNGNGDAHTVVGVTTFRNSAASAVQMFVDAGNNRVIVGSATALGSDTTPALHVVGRVYVAPSTANDLALQLRRDPSATVGWSMGVTSTADLVFKDDADGERFRVGDGAATYQAIVTGDFNVTDDAVIAGDLSSSRLAAGTNAWSGGEEFRVVGQSRMEGDLLLTTGTFRHENSGNARIEADGTGVGFFGATPIARPTVVGARDDPEGALANLLEELANLGLITDSTTVS
jgi:hypothetical protein